MSDEERYIHEEGESRDSRLGEEQRARDFQEAVRRVLSTSDGRLFVHALMGELGLYRSCYGVADAVEVGRREAALLVREWVLRCDPEVDIMMRREALDREYHYAILDRGED